MVIKIFKSKYKVYKTLNKQLAERDYSSVYGATYYYDKKDFKRHIFINVDYIKKEFPHTKDVELKKTIFEELIHTIVYEHRLTETLYDYNTSEQNESAVNSIACELADNYDKVLKYILDKEKGNEK